jgi:uncharacterized protein (DUF58 family)
MTSVASGQRPLREGRPKVRMTRYGWHFVALAILVLIGAVPRELNLLILLAGLMLGVIVVQWRFCRRGISAVSVRRSLPIELFARQRNRIVHRVQQHHRWLPAWAIAVEERIVPRSNDRAAPSSRRWRLTPLLDVGLVPSGEAVESNYELEVELPGTYRIGPAQVQSSFPFGLMTGRVQKLDAVDVVVYPAIGALTPSWLRLMQSLEAGAVRASRQAGSHEGEFFGLRPWQRGDSRRWIHWRTTARIGKPAVRQFEQQRAQRLALIVDIVDPTDEPACERMISFAATIVHRFTQEPGQDLAVAVGGKVPALHYSFQRRDFRRASLTALANASPSAAIDDRWIDPFLQAIDSRWPLVVLSTRASNDHPLAQRLRKEGSGGQSRAVHWIDVRDHEVSKLFQWHETESVDPGSAVANSLLGETRSPIEPISGAVP